MRILSVKGKNLTSLPEFDLDFERGQLQAVNLFAICGPTGAGKSTILDAICLALYNKTPRMAATGGVLVGHPNQDQSTRIAANDVRNVLRRGCGEGCSEVRFVARDGHTYQSTWSVRRARRNPLGRLQQQTISLLDSAGNPLGGSLISEVLSQIEGLIGLDFDQFRRSVLLAQGEFASFLKANPTERSELLQRMTRTELYEEVSILAHKRYHTRNRRLIELDDELKQITPLTEADRQEIESELANWNQELKLIRERLDTLVKWSEWHRQLSRLETELTSGKEQQLQVTEAWQAAQPDRTTLTQAEAVEHLRPDLAELNSLTRETEAAEERLKQASGEVAQLQPLCDSTSKQEETARQELQTAHDQLTLHKPLLDKARRLDVQVEEAHSAWQRASNSANERRAAANTQRAEVEALSMSKATLSNQSDECEQWLSDHQSWSNLVSSWDTCSQDLDLIMQSRQSSRELETKLERLEQVLVTNQSELESSGKRLATLQEERERLIDTTSELASKLAKVDRDSLLRQQDLLLAEQERIRAALILHQRTCDDWKATQKARESARVARQRRDQSTAEAKNIRQQIQQANQKLAEQKEQLRSAEAAMDLTQRRAELKAGQPCPLCGSNEHPWALAQRAFSQEASQARKHVASLEALVTDLNRANAGEEHLSKTAEETARNQEEEASAGEKRVNESRQRWSEMSPSLPGDLSNDILDATIASKLSQGSEEIQASLARVRQRTDEAHDLQSKLESANDLKEGNFSRREVESRKHNELQQTAHRHRTDQRVLQQQLEQDHETTRAATQRLGKFIGKCRSGWEVQLASSPTALKLELADGVTTFEERRVRLAEIEQNLLSVEIKLGRAQGQAEESERAAQTAEAEQSRAANQHSQLADQRKTLLGGRPTKQLADELELAVSNTESQLKMIAQQLSRNLNTLTQAKGRAEEAANIARDRQGELQLARESLALKMVPLDLDLAELERRLTMSSQQLQALRTRLERLQRQLDTCDAVTRERQRQVEDHKNTDRPDLDSEQVLEEIEKKKTLRQSAEEERNEILLRLKNDDQTRTQLAIKADEYQTQRKTTALYAVLDDLIGAANGSRFRNFAQSITLEILLAHANEHLRDLTHRYEIQKVPGTDLELQIVDRDMGDEVRSIPSLSGGESFLVSLALALGLASLSSLDTQIESLFIDEGFGTLDRETMEIALDALDCLQASGRKVGVISHVEGLADKIGVQIRVEKLGGGESQVLTEKME